MSGQAAQPAASRWDATPTTDSGSSGGGGGKRNRWDEGTPMINAGSMTPGATPLAGSGMMGMMTPAPQLQVPMTPEAHAYLRAQKEIDERNRPLSDAELDDLLPDGYAIQNVPSNYEPLMTPSRKAMATPTPMADRGYAIPEEVGKDTYDIPQTPSGDLLSKPEDVKFFGKLMEDVNEAELVRIYCLIM
jgi:splicing factor 3B subunit 1